MSRLLVLALVSGCQVVPAIVLPEPVAVPYCEVNASWAGETEIAKSVFLTSWNSKNLNPELKAIAWQESYNNTHIDHEASKRGPYFTAFGPLGLKPSTAHLEWSNSKKLQTAYPGLEDKIVFLRKMTLDPFFYNVLANQHWWRLKQQADGDVLRASFGWRWGAGMLEKATAVDVLSDEYVAKYAAREGIEISGF